MKPSFIAGILSLAFAGQAEAQSSRYYSRVTLKQVGVAGPSTPSAVAVSCGPTLAKTGPLSGTKKDLGYFDTVALGMAACEASSRAGYTPNLCQVVGDTGTRRYRALVMPDGVMNPTGTSPDYTIGSVTYSYYGAKCSPR